ncbi:ATP binding protein [Aureococcus anophagefferens]|nr:ATP binding protein [Aureococcus anophagefferens]
MLRRRRGSSPRREGGCGGDGLDAKLWDAAKAGLRGACAPAACSDAAGVASVRKARKRWGEAAVLDVAPWTLDRETLEDAGGRSRQTSRPPRARAPRRGPRRRGLGRSLAARRPAGLRDAPRPGRLRPPGKFAPADAVAVGATRFAERLLRKDGAALETAYLDEGGACVAPAVPAPPKPAPAPTAADHTAAYYKKWDAFDPSDSDDENTTTPGIDIQTGSPRPKRGSGPRRHVRAVAGRIDIASTRGVAGRKPRPKGEPPETPPEPPPRTTGRRKKPTWREVATRPF